MEGQKSVESFDDIGFQHQSRSLHSDNRTALLISVILCFFGILSLMLNIARLVRRREEPTEDGNAHVHSLGGMHMGTNPAAISIREAIANNLSKLQRRALLEHFFSNDINVSEENERESENDIETKAKSNDHNAKNETTSKNTIELVEEGRDCDSGTCNSNSRDVDLEAFESLPVYCGTPTRQRLHKKKISDEECQSTPQTCITEESPCSLNSRPAIETDKDRHTDVDEDAYADADADADADSYADTPGFKLSTPGPLIPEYQIMGPIISFPIELDDVSVSTNHPHPHPLPHPRARSESESNEDIEHGGTDNIYANKYQREDLNCEDSTSELDVCSICLDTYGKKETAIYILHFCCYSYSYACRIVA